MLSKLLNLYIDLVLSEFERYRRQKGGTWYQVCDINSATGFASAVCYWTKEAPIDDEVYVIKSEQY